MNDLGSVLLRSKEWPDVAQHVPAGASYLAVGATAFAFRLPDGEVLRVGLKDHAEERPPCEQVLQPTASKVIGDWLLETMPFADTKSVGPEDFQSLKTELRGLGYNLYDDTPGNIGRLEDGRVVVVDPGAANKLS